MESIDMQMLRKRIEARHIRKENFNAIMTVLMFCDTTLGNYQSIVALGFNTRFHHRAYKWLMAEGNIEELRGRVANHYSDDMMNQHWVASMPN